MSFLQICRQSVAWAIPIELEPGARPPFRPMYRLSPAERNEVKSYVKGLLVKSLIQPATSPYGAPILFVTK
jgi:hypothetical protein